MVGAWEGWVCRLLSTLKIHQSFLLANLLLLTLLATTLISLFITLFILLWIYYQLNLPRGIRSEQITFQVLNQISDFGSSFIRRKKRVGGSVTGFMNANHILWFNFRHFCSMETALSKVTNEIDSLLSCARPSTVWHQSNTLQLAAQETKCQFWRIPTFYASQVPHLPLLTSHLSQMAPLGSFLWPLNTSVSFFMAWVMFYL